MTWILSTACPLLLVLQVRKGSVYYLLMHLGDTATGSSVSIDTSAWGILPGTQVGAACRL